MKKEILELRAEGKTYNQIKDILGCSKGTISFHCGKGQKEKSHERSRLRKQTIQGNIEKRIQRYLLRMSRDFRNANKEHSKRITTHTFKVQEVLSKIGANPQCYLTGDNINLLDYKSYQFDHIKPVNKGGENSLDNLGLTTKLANMSKTDMELEEYLHLCEKVLRKHRPNILK